MNSNHLGAVQTIVLATVVSTLSAMGVWMLTKGSMSPMSGEWAATMQTVGSLVGIAIAIAIPAWQHHKSELSKEADRQIFAAAFASKLRPQLTELRDGLDYIVSDLGKEIEGHSDEEKELVWVDTGADSSPQVRFLEENWTAIAQLDGETVRAISKATALWRQALDENIDVENGTESYDDESGKWWEITFSSLERAKGYHEGNRLALEQAKVALSRLDASLTAS